MKSRLLLLAVSMTIVLVLTLTSAEVFVRHRERTRSTVPSVTPTLFYRHLRLRHALVHDYSYFGWVNTDTAGFRKTDNGERPAGAKPVVLVLGGSTTFDSEVSGDLKTWPARLEAWLRQESGFQGAVLNAGVSGYQVVDNLVRLLTVLADFQPDLILLYQAHNDLFSTVAGDANAGLSDRQRPWQVPAVAPWTDWLEQRSLLYGKLIGRVKALRFRGTGGGRATRSAAAWDTVLEAGAVKFERDLKSFVAVANARGIPVVLMTVTHVSAGDDLPSSERATHNWENTLPGVPPQTVLEGYRRFNARIAGVAAQYEIPLIDGAASGVVGLDLYAGGDPVHFSDSGADRFAQFVATELTPLLQQVP